MPLRLAHVSDVHLTARALDWRLGDWCSKRLFTWMNLRWFGRGRHFAQADQAARCLGDELSRRAVDRVIFSGDATALGFEAELRHAANLLKVGELPGLAVPGNHDYCTRAAAACGAFERVFAPWQQGDRLAADVYPFAQRVGDVWLIGLNSAKGNRWFWDASGACGRPQLERLRQLLASLPPGPRVLVTHYPVCLANRRREGFTHGLNDLRATVEAASAGGVVLWLHGHRHGFYWHQQPPDAPFPTICAGSATQTGLWSYGEYVLDGRRLCGTRRQFDPTLAAFVDAEKFELQLAGPRG